MEKIHGVNLGNWLVLEKWMHPDLFAGVDAEDEDALCRLLPRPQLEARLKQHRDTYITLEDFKWIKAHGLNTVRIPVPHFIFGDDPAFCDPYVPCIEYLDKAFDWAEEVGLKVLIDLHTAPESQNGFDNGGICGVCKFWQKPEIVDRVIKVLSMLSERYAQREGLFGVQILNEPVSPELWEFIKKRYPPVDPQRAEGSGPVPITFLYDFYTRAYHAIRQYLGEEKVVMFHDGFRLKMWKEFMQTPEFKNVWLDTHIYMMGAPGSNESKDMVGSVLGQLRSDIQEMSRHFPVVVGEWCLSHNPDNLEAMTGWQKDLSYRMMADAQLTAWDQSAGFFFWSYKLISEPAGWDFRKCVEKGWMPEVIGQ
ncbi:MAG: cellulase family glycosylhydrolase [Acutalibacter sp.]|nr:cellulase family glycosylhydrolase [Acutalibacter sp.]